MIDKRRTKIQKQYGKSYGVRVIPQHADDIYQQADERAKNQAYSVGYH